jgi:hypothetical protein
LKDRLPQGGRSCFSGAAFPPTSTGFGSYVHRTDCGFAAECRELRPSTSSRRATILLQGGAPFACLGDAPPDPVTCFFVPAHRPRLDGIQ